MSSPEQNQDCQPTINSTEPPEKGESRWPASISILFAMLMYLALPSKYVFGPTWVIPCLELSILLPLTFQAPRRLEREGRFQQLFALATVALVNIANLSSLSMLVHMLTHKSQEVIGVELIHSAFVIWTTNVIAFALWYWELDGGGPDDRLRKERQAPDFLFPQMSVPEISPKSWRPQFVDYLYLAFTNATAFSPTDVMPLSPIAKLLMLFQSAVSLITITLVAARAVNVLN